MERDNETATTDEKEFPACLKEAFNCIPANLVSFIRLKTGKPSVMQTQSFSGPNKVSKTKTPVRICGV
ncbi:Hypothetical predicted protein [Podarcis lilfordi]|uniref:Uncharacterized protein n=1 Tax=Podarcis lilfordi TaxID=74358 RepID=A0AA35NUI5_9SAUR|nr:Hypothetical predicted protein [Podarcis lilfordi]